MKKYALLILFLGTILGFMACEGVPPVEEEQKPDTEETTDSTTTNPDEELTDSIENPSGFRAVLVVDSLIGATATLSKTSGIVYADEIVLTITPNFEEGIWKKTPNVRVTNAFVGKIAGDIYAYQITGFSGDSEITITGEVVEFIDNSRIENGYEAIDLGLPSGLLWATCNVGATKPEEIGEYFAWGETASTNNYFCEDTYKYGACYWYDESYSELTKYNLIDGKTILDPRDDAATQNWGGNWRMPTMQEQQELIEHCTWLWTSLNGINGYQITGLNGNSIFMPTTGNYYCSQEPYYPETEGFYWSSSLSTSNLNLAGNLSFNSLRYITDDAFYARCGGEAVRAVCSPK